MSRVFSLCSTVSLLLASASVALTLRPRHLGQAQVNMDPATPATLSCIEPAEDSWLRGSNLDTWGTDPQNVIVYISQNLPTLNGGVSSSRVSILDVTASGIQTAYAYAYDNNNYYYQIRTNDGYFYACSASAATYSSNECTNAIQYDETCPPR